MGLWHIVAAAQNNTSSTPTLLTITADVGDFTVPVAGVELKLTITGRGGVWAMDGPPDEWPLQADRTKSGVSDEQGKIRIDDVYPSSMLIDGEGRTPLKYLAVAPGTDLNYRLLLDSDGDIGEKIRAAVVADAAASPPIP